MKQCTGNIYIYIYIQQIVISNVNCCILMARVFGVACPPSVHRVSAGYRQEYHRHATIYELRIIFQNNAIIQCFAHVAVVHFSAYLLGRDVSKTELLHKAWYSNRACMI